MDWQVSTRNVDDRVDLQRSLRAAVSARACNRRVAEETVRRYRGTGDLCGADSAVHVSGARANRACRRIAMDAVRHAVCTARSDRLACAGDPQLRTVLHRVVLRARR